MRPKRNAPGAVRTKNQMEIGFGRRVEGRPGTPERIPRIELQKEKTVQVKIVKGQVVITLPLQTPAPSASGKTLIVASSHGVKRSAVTLEGKELCVNANAFIYPSSPDDGKKSPVKPK